MSQNERPTRLGPVAGVGRRVQVAGAVIGALVIGLGYGFAKPAASSATVADKSVSQSTTTPISAATVVCPLVKDSSSTNISTFTPGTVSVSGTAAESVKQMQGSGSLLTAGKAGTLSTATGVSGGSAAAEDVNNPVVATATGADAAGFTVTETMTSGSGSTHGLASTNCGTPDTDFWFVGLGTDSSAYSMLNMANADNQSASVTITMYTAGGQLAAGENATSLQGITLSPNSEKSELINTLDTQKQGAPYAIHVVATSGRIAASVLDWDGNSGGRDFVAGQKSATTLVFPGIPQAEDNEKVQLTLLAPTAAAAVSLRWVGHSTIQPAVGSSFSGNLIQGKTATVDLSSVPTSGEYAALEVCGANSAGNQCLPVTGSGGAIPIVGEVKVSQSDQGGQDTAYISPAQALDGDGIVADDTSNSTLVLTNTGSGAAQVKLTETASGSSPKTASTTISVPAGQTVNAALSAPQGASGNFAIVVTPLNGAQHVYAGRIYATGSQLSIQSLTTAAETVTIPAVGQDSSGLVPQN